MFRPRFAVAVCFLLGGCAASPPYVYRYVPGRTAELHGEYASAPAIAPPEVHAAIAAGNRIAGSAYRRGGGHGTRSAGSAYDCSGAASFVLNAAGVLDTSMPSAAFRRFGQPGPGEWINVVARKDHVFLVVAGLRFDTGWTGKPRGPRWTIRTRPTQGAVTRHPPGL